MRKTLCTVSGKGVLSGQHDFPNQRAQDNDKVSSITGKCPAVWGSDFGFTGGEDKDSIVHRDLMIEAAKKQAAAGSIITLCWHILRPTEDEPGQPGASWKGSVQARLTDEQWEELITSDTPLHGMGEVHRHGGGIPEAASGREGPSPLAADAREQRRLLCGARMAPPPLTSSSTTFRATSTSMSSAKTTTGS